MRNIHATAIVVGTTGLLFTGPSGSGKSARAFACLAAAEARGLFSALVSDDRVLMAAMGGVVVAAAPAPIAGQMELRGSGIIAVRHVQRAVMHLAVLPGEPRGAGRLPGEDERFTIEGIGDLPALHLLEELSNPLAALAALHPDRLCPWITEPRMRPK